MNLPDEFNRRMKQMLGDTYPNFEASFSSHPISAGLRLNPLKKGAKEAVFSVTGPLAPIPWCREGYYCDKSVLDGNHPYHLAGLFYFQEPSAMSPVSGLPLDREDVVLDLCAAPGGKSTQAAPFVRLLVSNEIVPKRASVLAENIERFGLSNTVVTNESPQRLAEKYPDFFDKIIVDAPCSGEGMFRKEPQAAEQWSPEHTRSCAERQKHILDCAVKMLRPGGMLMYSTCTFAPEENEGVAAYLIQKHGLSLEPMPGLQMLSPGDGGWAGVDLDLSAARRIFPHLQNGEGHFCALFQKNGEAASQRKPVQKAQKPDPRISLYRDFEQDYLTVHQDGVLVFFGENLYLKPAGIDINKIKVLRCGLHLGVCKKGRFEPSAALALSLSKEDFRQTIDLHLDSKELPAYLRGETFSCDPSFQGWTAVLVNGYPLGWGKASGGILKNHFPKHLRRYK